MRKKFTMLLASLFLTMGTAWAQTALVDGVYTIKNLINNRGTLVAVENQENVGATDITLGGFQDLSEKAMTNGDKWYVRTVGANTYLYNIANGKFVGTRTANEAKFVEDPANGISLTSVANGRYRVVNGSYTIGVSLGWGIGKSIRWLTGSEDNSMNLDFTAVENGAESYATAITAANAMIDALGSSITIEAANGTVVDSWETSTWAKVAENIPADVTAAEKGQYGDVTSNIWGASKKIMLPAGSLRATLVFGDGNHRLDILGVDLLNEDGTAVVSSDYHFGFSGNQKVNNAYDLKIPNEGLYTIRYWVTFCKESNTSIGNITLQHYKLGIPVYSAAELSNEKVYTVTPADNASTGAWDVMTDGSRLSITRFSGSEVNAASANQQFAFLTVNGETYLYNYGTKKFVENDGGQKLTDNLSSKCLIEFLVSTIPSNQPVYPLVVKVGGNQLHSSYQSHLSGQGGIITTWQYTNSPGNAVAIVPVDGTVDLSAAIAKIEAYQIVELKKALKTVLDEANTLAGKSYIGEASKAALNAAISAAQSVYDNVDATFVAVAEQKDALSAAINAAGYVTTVDGFTNTAIYTFVSKRGWMGAADDAETVKSISGSADDPNSQWVVYKSDNEKYYLYNIGKEMFMGIVTTHNVNIPFAATPQMATLTFKKSSSEEYPIMFSVDNKGAVNNNDSGDMIYWSGGWSELTDAGNNHKVALVGELGNETLTKIADAVAQFELPYFARQELNQYLEYFKGAYYDEWNGNPDYKWRDQEGVNNYTIGYDNALTLEEYYNAAKTVADKAEATAEALTEALSVLRGVESWVSINQPEVGKFYRLRCVDGKKYLQSTIQTEEGSNKDRLTLSGNKGAEAAFLYDGQGLLSYTQGLYMNDRKFNTVGVTSNVVFSESTNGNRGCYIIEVGEDRYIYGKNASLDSGEPTDGNPENLPKDNGYNWWLEEVTELPVTVGAAGWGTFYTPVAVTVPTTVKAYTITAVGEKATLTQVEGTVPAGTGLILEGEGTHDFAIATEDDAEDFNKGSLEGAAAKTYVYAAPNTTYYVLAKPAGATDVALYKAKLDQKEGKAFLNGANKVYLPVTTELGAPAMFAFTRGDEEDTTGIESVEANEELVIFDLAGRRVEKMEKGIYIVNGKKVIK